MSTPKRLVIHWTTLKGAAAILLFILVAILAEYLVALYAINLGVEDKSLLQWSFTFPGTEWNIVLTVSPLFHLVPAAVVLSLAFSWICLTSYFTIKPAETSKPKAKISAKTETKQKSGAVRKFFGGIKGGLLKVKGVAYIWQKIHFARAAIKSALTLLLTFGALIIVVSLLAYPNLIYHAITGAYQNNPSLLDFVKGTAQFFAPVGAFFSAINSALIAAAPGFRDFVVAVGSVIGPLTRLDEVGKYLVFQNLAAWISALSTLLYGEYRRKVFRYRTVKRR
ncbi:MAG: hypothetical protein ACUVT9_01235 [Candidatus Bathycorpusculaceae bacterium]